MFFLFLFFFVLFFLLFFFLINGHLLSAGFVPVKESVVVSSVNQLSSVIGVNQVDYTTVTWLDILYNVDSMFPDYRIARDAYVESVAYPKRNNFNTHPGKNLEKHYRNSKRRHFFNCTEKIGLSLPRKLKTSAMFRWVNVSLSRCIPFRICLSSPQLVLVPCGGRKTSPCTSL